MNSGANGFPHNLSASNENRKLSKIIKSWKVSFGESVNENTGEFITRVNKSISMTALSDVEVLRAIPLDIGFLIRHCILSTDELKKLQMDDGTNGANSLKYVLYIFDHWTFTCDMIQRYSEVEKCAYSAMSECRVSQTYRLSK